MKSTNKKLRNLEECVLKPIVNGSSMLDVSGLSEAEQKLFAKAYRIHSKWKNYANYEPDDWERVVLNAALKRIIMRSIDLFTTCLCNYMAEGDPKKEALWRVHFWKFMFNSASELTGQKPRFHPKFWKQVLRDAKKCPILTNRIDRMVQNHV